MNTLGGLRPGKLPATMLARLLAKLDVQDPRVLLGASIGEDAALIDFGTTTLIATTDPVTFATDLIGWYAVQVNANDIAACGGDPRWFMATVLLPEGTMPGQAEAVFDQMREAADALDVALIGGHTEITIGLPRPIVCGTMLGEAPRGTTLGTGGARPGDALLLTKGIAIEGTSVLARERATALKDAGVSPDLLEAAGQFLFKPGISVVRDARVARDAGGATAMHDPTEGGLATALAELAEASGVGVEVDRTAVPLFPETVAICEALGADPWGLLASGALLIAAAPDAADRILAGLRDAGIAAVCIGRATEPETSLRLLTPGGAEPLPAFERDEVARILEA